jgi:hypothetical protein
MSFEDLITDIAAELFGDSTLEPEVFDMILNAENFNKITDIINNDDDLRENRSIQKMLSEYDSTEKHEPAT